jgi:chromosome segregation ATPase
MRGNSQNLGVIFDETVKRLNEEVRTLRTQQASLNISIKDLESRKSALTSEILKLNEELKGIKLRAESERDRITEQARQKLEAAVIREAEAAKKDAELNQKLKEADNLIKSNQSLQANLVKQNEDIEVRVEKLKRLIGLIRETLKTL